MLYIMCIIQEPYKKSTTRLENLKPVTPGEYMRKRDKCMEAFTENCRDSTLCAVLRAILNRVWGYGKDSEVIPMRHLLDGVTSKDGVKANYGLPYALSTIKLKIKELDSTYDNKGNKLLFISWKRSKYTGRLTHSFEPNHNFLYNDMLKRARAKKQYNPEDLKYETLWDEQHEKSNKERVFRITGRDDDQPSSLNEGAEVQSVSGPKIDLYKEDVYKGEDNLNKNCDASAAIPARRRFKLPLNRRIITPVIETLEDKEECSAPPSKYQFEYGKIPTARPQKELSDYEQAAQLWQSLEKEYVTAQNGARLSPVMAWGKKQRGQMKCLITKWKAGGGTIEDFLELITDSITQWAQITSSMKLHQAVQPSLGLFVQCFTGFRDYKNRSAIVKEKAEEYREVVKDKRDALRMRRFEATGKLSPRDAKAVRKEERKTNVQEFYNPVSPLVTYKERREQERQLLEKLAEDLPPTEYDDEGNIIFQQIPIFDNFSN